MPRRPFGVTCGACLVVAAACMAQEVACRDGACEPHCPVRPGQFGYYPTQWRRWPGGGSPSVRPADAATPASPGRSVVPNADEESPAARGAATPGLPARAAAVPAAWTTGADDPARDAGERLGRLVEEADSARLADAERRREFALRLVSAMLSEHDPQARCTVLALAAGFDAPAAAAICVGALEDPDPRVRSAACGVAAERRATDAVPGLARLARTDADLGVRLRAIRALGELGDPAVIPPLATLLDDPDVVIRSRTMAALTRATGRDLGADIERWRKWAADPAAPPPRRSLAAALRGLLSAAPEAARP